jgi:hypothetical protein
MKLKAITALMTHKRVVKQTWGLKAGDDKVDLTDGGGTYDELRIVRKVAEIWRNKHFCNAPIYNTKAIAYSIIACLVSTNQEPGTVKSASTIALEASILDLPPLPVRFKKQCSPE